MSDKQGDWNANNVQSAGGGFLVVGDELYFYVSGRTGRPGDNKAGTLTTGLATLRRDGFASMDAGETAGTLTTRPVRFAGKHLFVNLDDPKGELRVEILDQAGQVLPRFTRENCLPLTTDAEEQPSRESARILFPPEKREYELVDIFASAGLMRRGRGRLIFETVENFGSAPSWREFGWLDWMIPAKL